MIKPDYLLSHHARVATKKCTQGSFPWKFGGKERSRADAKKRKLDGYRERLKSRKSWSEKHWFDPRRLRLEVWQWPGLKLSFTLFWGETEPHWEQRACFGQIARLCNDGNTERVLMSIAVSAIGRTKASGCIWNTIADWIKDKTFLVESPLRGDSVGNRLKDLVLSIRPRRSTRF